METRGIGELMVCQDPKSPRPPTAARIIEDALRDGVMPRTLEAFRDPPGNCRDVAFAIMADLHLAERSLGFSYVEGYTKSHPPKSGGHAWVEFDGWVLDFAGGKAFLFDSKVHEEINGPVQVTLCVPWFQFRDHMSTIAEGVCMGMKANAPKKAGKRKKRG